MGHPIVETLLGRNVQYGHFPTSSGLLSLLFSNTVLVYAVSYMTRTGQSNYISWSVRDQHQ